MAIRYWFLAARYWLWAARYWLSALGYLFATNSQKRTADSLKPLKSITIKKIYRFLAFYNIFWKNNLVNSVFF
jgi:hypothetical protein